MKKRTTQLLSVLLALCIALALLPGTALAMGYFDPETGAITGCDNEETELNIPSMINGVPITSINYWAFHGHGNLTSVTIPESITSIGFEAFLGCTNLTSINVASGNPEYSSVGGVLFNADQTVLIAYPAGKSDQSYSIPSSVTTIGLSAFACSDNLTSVTIPYSVTSIEQRAFSSCRSLTGVTIPGSVTTIGQYAFEDCRSLTGVTIPNSITSIGSNAFIGCNSLTDVYYDGNESQWNQIDIGNSYGADNPLLNATIHYNSTGPEPSAPAPEAIPATGTAHPSAQTVELDGKQIEFQMYALLDDAGNPTNYIKVRDLALAMNGTKGQFNVDWIDAAVTLVAGEPYTTPNGSENSTPFSGERSYKLPENPTNVGGAASGLTAFVLTDDEGGDYTYYKLRDLGQALGFNVGYADGRGVYIETDKPYTDAD